MFSVLFENNADIFYDMATQIGERQEAQILKFHAPPLHT